MTIGETARRAGVGIETIRFYERQGLLHDVRILAEEKMRDIGERIRSLHRIELALQRLV